MRKDYKGLSFDYATMPCFTPGGMGHIVMFRKENGEYTIGGFDDSNFWMKDMGDDFQNIEHLTKGLEYIDQMKNSGYKFTLLEIIDRMKGQTGGMKFSQMLGFLCELGCWEDEKNRQPYLYDKDFYKYARRCMKEYERAII